WNFAFAVAHDKANAQIVALDNAASLDQAAKANAFARRHLLLDDIARRIEEYNRLLQCAQDKRSRQRQHAEAATDQNESPLFARHPSIPSPLTISSTRLSLSGSLASARRALTTAACA